MTDPLAPRRERRTSPAAERNAAPILAELLRLLPTHGALLEIASGTGQHAARFAAALPAWRVQPSDRDRAALGSIEAWCDGLANVAPPIVLDVVDGPWPGARYDAIFCANLIHIAPWPVCAALIRGAASRLADRGVLVTYGPYLEDDVPTAPGNLAFDADLRARDPAWGVRRLEDVRAEAGRAGMTLAARVAMPANNLLLAWRRRAAP